MPMIKKNRPAAVSFGLFTLTCIPLLDFGCAGKRRGSGGAADGHAAANIEDLAGNERGRLAHEEGGGMGDVRRGAEPAASGAARSTARYAPGASLRGGLISRLIGKNPSWAKRSTMPRPIPFDAPVTRTDRATPFLPAPMGILGEGAGRTPRCQCGG